MDGARPPTACLPTLVLGATLCLGALAPAPAAAASREQAIAAALAETRGQGRVLSAQRERTADGREVWAVKVIVDGRVRVHRVSAD